jgi:hypothetical protein
VALLTPTVIANELLMRFKNRLSFAAGASHEYDDRFDKIGDSYLLRDSAQFVANDGADITAQIQDVNENSKTLQINKRKNVAFQFSSKDLTLTVDRFAERYLDGASIALANKFDTDGLTLAYQTCPNLVGTAGTTPATAAVILAAGQKMDESSCPVDDQRHLVVNPAAQASMVDAMKGLFQSSTEIGKQYKSGRMGTALGFDWAMSQNVRTHTVGAWAGTALLNGVPAQGATTIAVDGLTGTTTIKAGDKFTLPLVYAVNPVTGDALPTLRQFTVLADATSASGAIAALSIYPAIKSTGPGATVSALPADDAALTKVGTASTGYPMNIAYHKHAFVYASVPLVVPQGVHFGKTAVDKETGLSIRIVSQYNVLTDVFVTRADIAYGWKERRPEWASVIIG